MPELPEVETIKLQLSQLIIGLIVKNIEVISPKSFIEDPKLLIGAKITSLRRFAKILTIDFDCGLSLVVHLKMTGQLIYQKAKNNKLASPARLASKRAGGQKTKNKEELPNKYTRVVISFRNGDRLYFNDMRRFGWMRVVREQKTKNKKQKYKNILLLKDLTKKIGPDPLTISSREFKKILKTSKKPVKLLLMDQQKIGGVGNIYANETLFLAGINPQKEACKLLDNQAIILISKLKKVLKDGVKWGGASRFNYRDAYGNKGEVQKHFYVYDREDEGCANGCGANVRKIKLGGRGTYFCPKCQPLDR